MDMVFDEGPFYPKIFNSDEKAKIRSHKLWKLVQHLHINSGGELRVASIASVQNGSVDELTIVDKTGYAVFFLRKYIQLDNFSITAVDYENLKRKGRTKNHIAAKNVGYLIKRLPAGLIMHVVKQSISGQSYAVNRVFSTLTNSIDSKLKKLYDPRFSEFVENIPYDKLADLFESVMDGDTIDKMNDSTRDMVIKGNERAARLREYETNRDKTLSSVYGKNGAYVFSVMANANFFCVGKYIREGDIGYRCEQPMVAYRSLDDLPADCVDYIKFSLLTCKMNRGDPFDTDYLDSVLPRSLSGTSNFYEDTNSFHFNQTSKSTIYFVMPA